jgi:thiol:disulfide interchange protein DsbA
MNRIKSALLLGLMSASLWMLPGAANAQAPYITVTPAQHTEVAPGKIEVLEFFWYGCPHCFELEPELAAWAKKLPAHVVFKRQPAIFSDRWEPLAKAYFALEALGEVERLHGALLNTIHAEGRDLNAPEAFFAWAAAQGVDANKLKTAYQSFSVFSKVAKARQLSKAYPLKGVPALVINGKYLSSPSDAGGYVPLLRVADQLIARESKR